MPINPYVNQYNRQLDAIRRREAKLFRVRAPRNAPGGSLMAKIEERIPEKLRGLWIPPSTPPFRCCSSRGPAC